MITGRLFKQTLEKFFMSPVVQDSRVQVCLPSGEFFDIKGVQLMENKILGRRESHRLVITIQPEQWTMGKVIKRL